MTWTLITGASEGLGAEFAHLAAKSRRNVILTARSEDKLNAVADAVRAKGVEAVVIPADLSRLDEVERLWAQATDGREVDTLVNNAGLGLNGDFAEPAGWDRELLSIQVNMLALTRLMKLAIPHMTALPQGRILNVGSLAGFVAGPNMAVYHASKAYVLSLSEAVAEEMRGRNVTVTVLCPGATATSFFEDADMDGVRLLNLAPPMRASDVARAGWHAMLEGQRVHVPGLRNKLSAFSTRLSPRGLATRITGVLMGKG